MSTPAVIALFFLAVLVYALPGIVADRRRHPQAGAIWVLTILGGWTVAGWIAAMVWAATNPRQKPLR